MPSLVREKKYNGSIVACTIGEGKDKKNLFFDKRSLNESSNVFIVLVSVIFDILIII